MWREAILSYLTPTNFAVVHFGGQGTTKQQAFEQANLSPFLNISFDNNELAD